MVVDILVCKFLDYKHNCAYEIFNRFYGSTFIFEKVLEIYETLV